ncbi:hypothetical protein C8Q80DRAFT_1264289 [Daedaleopsis nitida]|nr:hypothetical protein C8Q80DRAFT_1264289 [Daedaleopsis nitida]
MTATKTAKVRSKTTALRYLSAAAMSTSELETYRHGSLFRRPPSSPLARTVVTRLECGCLVEHYLHSFVFTKREELLVRKVPCVEHLGDWAIHFHQQLRARFDQLTNALSGLRSTLPQEDENEEKITLAPIMCTPRSCFRNKARGTSRQE